MITEGRVSNVYINNSGYYSDYYRRAIAGVVCLVFALLAFCFSPTLSYAAEPQAQTLRVLLNAWHATVNDGAWTSGDSETATQEVLADLRACNNPDDAASFEAWYALQDGESYIDLKEFADFDNHKALRAWDKYMYWLSTTVPTVRGQSTLEMMEVGGRTGYVANVNKFVFFSDGDNLIAVQLLGMIDAGNNKHLTSGDGWIVGGKAYDYGLSVSMSRGAFVQQLQQYYSDLPDFSIGNFAWFYDAANKDLILKVLVNYNLANQAMTEWVDIPMFIFCRSNGQYMYPLPVSYWSDFGGAAYQALTTQERITWVNSAIALYANNSPVSVRNLGNIIACASGYTFPSFSYCFGNIQFDSSSSFTGQVDRVIYDYATGKPLLVPSPDSPYLWQDGSSSASQPGYILDVPVSSVYKNYAEAFELGQVVAVSGDYTHDSNRLLSYGTLMMEDIYATKVFNYWNTSLVIMGDDYEVDLGDEVISGGGAGGTVGDAIDEDSLGKGENDGNTLIDRPELFRKFPFSIPYDLGDIILSFKAAPRAPVFTFPFSNFGAGVDASVDLAAYDDAATAARIGEFVLFLFSLVAAGAKMLGFSFGGGS